MDGDHLQILQLLPSFLGNNPEERRAADLELQRKFREDPFTTLFIVSDFISMDNTPDNYPIKITTIWQFSFILMTKCISFEKSFIDHYNENIPLDQKLKLKKCVFVALNRKVENIEAVINAAGHFFASLMIIEKNNILDELVMLGSLCQNPDFPNRVYAYHILTELCIDSIINNDNYKSDAKTIINEIYKDLFEGFHVNDNSIIFKSAIGLKRIANLCPPIFDSNEVLLEIVSRSQDIFVNCANEQTYGSVLSFLSTLTNQMYGYENFNEPVARDLSQTVNYGFQIPRPLIASYTIDYWTSVAKFERKKVIKVKQFNARYIETCKQYNLDKKDKRFNSPPELPYKQLIEHNLGTLLPQLIRILAMINIEDIDPEELQVIKPHMYAAVCLKELYQIAPQQTFETIKAYKESNLNITDWRIVNSIALCISTLCAKPIHPSVKDLIGSYIDTMFQNLSSPIPCVVDTTLYLFKLVFMYYPVLFLNQLGNVFASIDNLVTPTSHYVIVIRSISVLTRFFTNAPKEENWFQDFMAKNFNMFMSLYDRVKMHPDYIKEDLIRKVSDSISVMIQKLPSNCAPFAQKLLQQYMSEINTIYTTMESDFAVKASNLLIPITAIITRFPTEMQSISPDVLAMLVQLMKNLNREFHEEALVCIIKTTESLPKQNLREFKPVLESYISERAMSSGNPTIITRATMALSSLYKHCPDLIDGDLMNLQRFFLLVNSCLNSPIFTPPKYPYLLTALASVIDSSRKKIIECTSDSKPQCQEALISIYERYMNFHLNYSKPEDVKFANELYSSVLKGFKAVLLTHSNEPEFSKSPRNRKRFTDILKSVSSIPHISRSLYFDLTMYLDELSKVLGKNGNIIVNRNVNKMLLMKAASVDSSVTELKIFALRVFKSILES